MADQQQSSMDRASAGDMAPIGGTTTGAGATGDPTQTGGLHTPGAGTGLPTPGIADPRDAPAPDVGTRDIGMGGDPADVVTQVDGAYGGTSGGTGATGGMGGPDVIGGLGGALGGMGGTM